MCRLLCRLISGHTGNSGERWGSDRPSFRGVVVLENRAHFLENSGFSPYFYQVIGRGAGIRTRDLLRPRQARYQAALRPDRRRERRPKRFVNRELGSTKSGTDSPACPSIPPQNPEKRPQKWPHSAKRLHHSTPFPLEGRSGWIPTSGWTLSPPRHPRPTVAHRPPQVRAVPEPALRQPRPPAPRPSRGPGPSRRRVG